MGFVSPHHSIIFFSEFLFVPVEKHILTKSKVFVEVHLLISKSVNISNLIGLHGKVKQFQLFQFTFINCDIVVTSSGRISLQFRILNIDIWDVVIIAINKNNPTQIQTPASTHYQIFLTRGDFLKCKGASACFTTSLLYPPQLYKKVIHLFFTLWLTETNPCPCHSIFFMWQLKFSLLMLSFSFVIKLVYLACSTG